MSVVAPSVPYMKRVLKVRMLSTGPEAAALEATLLACNRAASWLSAAMYADRVHSKNDAQKRFYAELKRQFQLSAQPTIRVIGKVAEAQRTERGIAVEQLAGIRARVRLRKPQRAALHSWAFAQLGAFIAYKAKRAGVAFVEVNPAYTSQMCHVWLGGQA